MFKITTPLLAHLDVLDEPSTSSSAGPSKATRRARAAQHYASQDVDMDADDFDVENELARMAVEQDPDALGEGSSNFTSPGTVITSSAAFMRWVLVLSLSLSLFSGALGLRTQEE